MGENMGGLGSKLSGLFRRSENREKSRLKLLAWATLASLIFGAIEFGTPLDDNLRMIRNYLRRHDASGQVVVLAIDDRTLGRGASWPWPRQRHAQLVEELNKLGARAILFEPDFSSRGNPADNKIFEDALARMKGKVTLATRFTIDPLTQKRTELLPYQALARDAQLANTNFRYDGKDAVWQLPLAMAYSGKAYPSLSAAAAGVSGKPGSMFWIDYGIDPVSIPTVSAIDVLERRVSSEAFAGKTVMIGVTAQSHAAVYSFPGYRRIPSVYLHALGAETLRAGSPVDLGWLVPLICAVFIGLACVTAKNSRLFAAALVSGFILVLVGPLMLEALLISTQITPALFLLLVVGGVLGWNTFRQAYRARGVTNPLSGLPNLNALRAEASASRSLVAARVQNYAEVSSALPAEEEKALVEQIASRLRVGNAGSNLYHGDEGIFAWFVDEASERDVGDHLEALHALFRSPFVVSGNQVDLSISFGLESDAARSLANRLGSALVAADEAAAEGLRWKQYDPAKLKDAAWKLSLLSQLDAAIEAGDLWVAYQPKLDLKTNRIIGAEALVRWNHPEKGYISPLEFILAAEQNNRIERLTFYVLDRAIGAAASINRRGIELDMSVNLSARLIDDPALVRLVTDLLKQHRLPAHRLTLEVTETAALSGSARFDALLELRDLGVQVSIDDYGTGLSTLDYLKRIPATEIKIDKSFVQSLGRSQSDTLLVNSTIQLAHSLGHIVVAEGVEDQATLDALTAMGCDVAQGYLIGRPVPFDALKKQLAKGSNGKSALPLTG